MSHTLLTCDHTLRLRLERQAAVLTGCPARWAVISLRGSDREERRMAWGQSLRGEGRGRCL